MRAQTRSAVVTAAALAFVLVAPAASAQQSGTGDSGSMATHGTDSAMSHPDKMAHGDKMSHADQMKKPGMAHSSTPEGSGMAHDNGAMAK